MQSNIPKLNGATCTLPSTPTSTPTCTSTNTSTNTPTSVAPTIIPTNRDIFSLGNDKYFNFTEDSKGPKKILVHENLDNRIVIKHTNDVSDLKTSVNTTYNLKETLNKNKKANLQVVFGDSPQLAINNAGLQKGRVHFVLFLFQDSTRLIAPLNGEDNYGFQPLSIPITKNTPSFVNKLWLKKDSVLILNNLTFVSNDDFKNNYRHRDNLDSNLTTQFYNQIIPQLNSFIKS